MTSTVLKYWRVWFITASNMLQETFVNRATNAFFMFGKILRLSMNLIFLHLLRENTHNFAGYTADQMVIFYLTYQFIDVFSQVFYRGVYVFGQKVRSGEFDLYLSKPISPLFRALTSHPDINDALFLIPSTIISIGIGMQLNLNVSTNNALLYFALLLNAFCISTAIHILVLAIGVITTEVDGTVWLFRDVLRLAQWPMTLYFEPLRTILFYIIPVGIMVTMPAHALLGMQSQEGILLSFALGVGSLIVSMRFWHWSLRQYSSASS